MDRSRNIIIVLIITILILIIALVGAMVYIFMNQNDDTKDSNVVNNANNNTSIVENEDENEIDTENIIQNPDVENEYANEIENTVNSEIDNNEDEENTTGDMDKLAFNTPFISYLGNISGEKLNTLLITIENSNINNPEHQITLSSNTLQSLDEIVVTETYTITLSYDDNGYISNINIDKKLN